MAKQKQTVGLIAFLKGNSDPKAQMPGCANYDHHYGGCLFCWKGCNDKEKCKSCMDFWPYTKCRIEIHRRCRYSEQAVFPTATDIGQSEHIHELYQAHVGLTGNRLKTNKTRPCPDCGGELLPRQRYCSDCKRKRKLESKRNWKRKKTG